MLALIIISFGILSRLVIHVPNFSPILSMAFLGGMYLKGRQALWVPLVLMVVSDIIIGFYPLIYMTWCSIFLISILGFWLKERKSLATVFAGSMASAVIFFIITNFASWITLYPQTTAGLKQCYLMAIPFFRSTLISTLAYSLVFYTSYEWIVKRNPGIKIHTY